jgi:hypothetical protein
VLRQQRKGTRRDLRLWTAQGLRLIANSSHGIGDDASFFESHCVSLLWWNWRPHLRESLRDGQRLPLSDPPARCFKPNAPSANHPNVDKEFRRLIRLGYLEGPYKAGDRELHCVNSVLGVPKKDSPDKPRMCVNMTDNAMRAVSRTGHAGTKIMTGRHAEGSNDYMHLHSGGGRGGGGM